MLHESTPQESILSFKQRIEAKYPGRKVIVIPGKDGNWICETPKMTAEEDRELTNKIFGKDCRDLRVSPFFQS